MKQIYSLVLEMGDPFNGKPERDIFHIDEDVYDILLEAMKDFPNGLQIRDLPNFTGRLIARAVETATKAGLVFDDPRFQEAPDG
jgi:hypothetical protein